MPEAVRIAFDVATATPVRYPIAVVASTKQPAVAKDFVSFVADAPGRKILARHGFRPA
jgi:molybdate transport system substrate-binding protein